jgi:AcrR family transcriptional regulator
MTRTIVARAESDHELMHSVGWNSSWRSRVVGRSLGEATERAVDRGQALISAVGRLIQQSGVDDFTMQQVAAEAGLSLRVVYQLFSGKDDLLVALIEESQAVFARLLEWHAARHSDPLEKLGAALYFATDPRQHPNASYNAALARFVVRISACAPAQLGRARRPVTEVVEGLVAEAMTAGEIDPGDPELAAGSVLLAYNSYQLNTVLGSAVGATLPSNEQFIRFCLCGLGARLLVGWEERLRLTDDEAARYRREAAPRFRLPSSSKARATQR